MIVNVEAGSTSASLTTLLRLTGPLRTSLAALVEDVAPTARLSVTRASDRQALWRGRDGGYAALVASADTPDMLELWEWVLRPGETYESDWHSAGTHELIHVHSGVLTLTLGSATATLRAGDSTGFVPDESHSYANHGRGSARFSMAVFEPTRRVRP